jgi:hypothetical protein
MDPITLTILGLVIAVVTFVPTTLAYIEARRQRMLSERTAALPRSDTQPDEPKTRPDKPAGQTGAIESAEPRADPRESSCGLDYRRLNGLLAAAMWKEANDETISLLLRASGRESLGALDGGEGSQGTLGDRDIAQLPASDLNTIDHLWTKHSQGRFGFSIQSKILNEEADWDRFCRRVGWMVPELLYEHHAPLGHLPTVPPHFAAGHAWNEAMVLARFRECTGGMLSSG